MSLSLKEAERFLQQDVGRVLPSFERRGSQLEMLRACAEVIEEGGTLLVEAPTGVGKTLAYLVPILLSERKAIVSTRTINLQEQLCRKDLPLLARALGSPDSFRFELAKGFSNYLCRLFLEALDSADPARPKLELDLADAPDPQELRRLLEWARQTKTGDREELPFEPHPAIWDEVCADANACLRRECDFYESCFYFRARRSWEEATILVANHSLVAMDSALYELKGRGGGEPLPLLPKADILVLDEAHRLDEVFSEIFTAQLTQLGLERLVSKLIGRQTPQTRRGSSDSDVDAEAEGKGRRKGRKAKALPSADSLGLLHHHLFYDEALIAEVERLRSLGEGFFLKLREAFPDPCKVRVLPEELDPRLRRELELLGMAIADLGGELEELRRDHPLHRGSSPEEKRLIARLNQSLRTLEHLGQAATLFLDLDEECDPHLVRWVEISGRRAALVTGPLYPAEGVQLSLIPRYRTIILTSATLSVAGDFSFIQERLGFAGRTLSLRSGFNWSEQAKLYIKGPTPPPQLTEDYLEELASSVAQIIRESGGGVLVLFTSWRALRGVKERLERQGLPYLILAQGDKPRQRLLEEFQEEGNAVLLGTSSFWEGVDVPGPALRTLIITRLPFEVPDDPITQGRMEDLRRQGKDPFMDYILPQAILRFKQGFGRLIRTSKDRGVVWVLDDRLVRRPYGRKFLESLPEELKIQVQTSDPEPD